jgi:hypothetical protein
MQAQPFNSVAPHLAADLHHREFTEGSCMRLLTVVVLSISVLDAACGRAETAAARNDLTAPPAGSASPSTAAERAEPGAGRDAVATAGKSSAAADARPAREVTIPAGTTLPIVLDTPIASNTSRPEQAVVAHLARPIALHGETVLPAGSRVSGVVTDAKPSGRVKGRAHVAVRFDSLTPSGGERYEIRTASVGRTAEATKKKDALEIGAPAAGGAIIGALVGGKKGALVGGAIGGGAGTGVVLATKGKEVRLPKGSALSLKLAAPVTVRVRE